MSDPVRFLNTFAQTLSVMTLYPEGHPSRERIVDAAFEDLDALFADGALPRFTFLEGEVVYGRQSLRDLREWEWSARLAECGVSRLEFERRMTRDEFEGFLQEIQARLTHSMAGTSAQRQMRDLGVRFGSVGLELASTPAAATGGLVTGLVEEVDTLHWMQAEVLDGRGIPMLEAEAVVRSLSIAMHADAGMLLPLLQLKEFDQYTTTHALNVAVLSMALAERLGLSSREILQYGMAGLLHDLGKIKVPVEILRKPGKLTPEELEAMRQHPADGARLILARDDRLDLCATVAFEHHIMIDGGGYPSRMRRCDCHHASMLVHVCDVYDALRTNRPYRIAWEATDIASYIEGRIGLEFESTVGRAFLAMIGEADVTTARADIIDDLIAQAG